MTGARPTPLGLGRAARATLATRAALVWLVMLSACSGSDGGRREVAIGKMSPPYAATRLEGGLASLDELRGRVVLLNVWATWCAPCREEIPYLQSLYDRHAKDGLEIVGVSVDATGSEETIKEFRRDFKMTYPIWLDPDERVQTLYLALGVPASYLIDRDGILRWKHLGTVRPTDTTFTRALGAALGTSGDD
jgi:thiol-disulfide isomerase/thioredoxin